MTIKTIDISTLDKMIEHIVGNKEYLEDERCVDGKPYMKVGSEEHWGDFDCGLALGHFFIDGMYDIQENENYLYFFDKRNNDFANVEYMIYLQDIYNVIDEFYEEKEIKINMLTKQK